MSKSQVGIDGGSHARAVEMGSDRSFGLVFAAVFAIVALLPLKDGGEVRLWAGAVAGAFLLVALVYPKALKPLNKLWFLIGMALHHVVTPLVMGLLFFLTVTPIALIMRAVGKDPLHLARDDKAASYWINRTPPGPAPDSMRRQF
ncbi:SxtJ family membrane protein [Magnetospirillum sp. XM-1]|uniref:SxtJ family membrane protein n=1 Tax=Magnetospirillum sp. XM-1 TaxID=1663591 RepID=UPI000837E26F|nr:SxtJ family membrane protein [Magnetospirillum sp. XM-1]